MPEDEAPLPDDGAAVEHQTLKKASRKMEAHAGREHAAAVTEQSKAGAKEPQPSETDDALAASRAQVAASQAYLDDVRRQDGLSQSDRFIAKARELGADGDEEAFKGVLRKLAKQKGDEKSETKRSAQ